MTKEAKDEVMRLAAHANKNISTEDFVALSKLLYGSDEEVFENRTCDNCYNYFKGECRILNDWDCYNDEPCNWTPPSGFGCNKFKDK